MRRIFVRVTLSELASQVNAYPPWELPILDLVHGGQLRQLGTMHDDEPVPSPEAEYIRLERRFGRVKDDPSGRSRVSQAYGEGALGIARLAEAMAEDLAEQAQLDALPAEDRELLRLQNERARLDRDIESLERRRRADGSGPEAYRAGIGRERVEAIRRAEEEQRKNVGQGADASRALDLDKREQELAAREQRLAVAEAAQKEPAEPKPDTDAVVGADKPAEDAADTPRRGRRRA